MLLYMFSLLCGRLFSGGSGSMAGGRDVIHRDPCVCLSCDSDSFTGVSGCFARSSDVQVPGAAKLRGWDSNLSESLCSPTVTPHPSRTLAELGEQPAHSATGQDQSQAAEWASPSPISRHAHVSSLLAPGGRQATPQETGAWACHTLTNFAWATMALHETCKMTNTFRHNNHKTRTATTVLRL